MNDDTFARLPKADMHVHIEATMTPALMRRIASRNGLPVPENIIVPAAENFGRSQNAETFGWPEKADARENLIAFVNAYDVATAVLRTPADFRDLAYDYLTRAAAEGCIYAEPIISADHGRAAGVSYPDMLAALAAGAEQAKAETGIESRFISTAVRHYGPEKCLNVGRETAAYPHPLVTAFGLAGDENAGTFQDFAPAFEAAALTRRSVHAAEAAGPQSALDALNILNPQRLGHGVRLIESPAAMETVRAAGITLEVCVSSNLAMRVFNSFAEHPLRRLHDAGLKIVLGSDDPSFFGTSIGREYRIARDHFGFSGAELLGLTRNAAAAAFTDDATRARLMEKVEAFRPCP